MAPTMGSGERLFIEGVVQGVGFRPHLWSLAQRFAVQGRVRNEGGAVVAELWGDPLAVDSLVQALLQSPPPLARIERLSRTPLAAPSPVQGFVIEESRPGQVDAGLSADAAICDECLRELNDPADRRYRYPFINCTHCGPRLTLTRTLPYDRVATSMAPFPLCPDCEAEYASPATRRFHAQATACPACGPQLWLSDAAGEELAANGEAALQQCAERIAGGEIVAIRGLGGFHLACDATNGAAVQRLRGRKGRPHQPFAVMVQDLAMARCIAMLTEVEEEALASTAAPIVLLQQRPSDIAPGVAPGLNEIGCMLAYSGLHRLLLQTVGRPLVMTSGNRHGEPLLAGNDEALAQLAGIADAFLLHDREIMHRLDDSVVRIIAGRPRLLRRARGFVPNSLPLPPGFETADAVLAMGAEMKGGYCLLQRGRALLSPYLGALSQLGNFEHYRNSLADSTSLFQFTAQHIAIDSHPAYRASEWGRALAVEHGAVLSTVQHHHAHIAAVMAEHDLPLQGVPVLGIALDGLGHGGDGTLWGGELLLAHYSGYRRLAAFDAVPLPGGDAASREPWRNAFAHLEQALGWTRVQQDHGALECIQRLQQKPLATIKRVISQGLNSPRSSSCGRLFDAAAALLGICFDEMSYEGQAAIELESLAQGDEGDAVAYPCGLDDEGELHRIRWAPLLQAVLGDLSAGVAPARIAARFHRGVVAAVAELAKQLCEGHGVTTVVLCGGVMQNRLIAEGLVSRLTAAGLIALLPQQLPANDGGIALGQAVVAAAHRLAAKGGEQ